MKTLTLIILSFISLCMLGQTPTLPSWVNDTIYIDYSAPVQGDGSIESPYNSIPPPDWPTVYDIEGHATYGTFGKNGNTILWAHNRAFLFKKGITHNTPNITFSGDSMYVGSYGQGEVKPLIIGRYMAYFKQFHLNDLEFKANSGDTTYLQRVLDLRGDGPYRVPIDPHTYREPMLYVNNVDVTFGYTAISFERVHKAYFDNIYMTEIWHDGFFGHACDSVFIDNWHIKNYCREWAYPTTVHEGYHETGNGVPGGDGIQVTGGYETGSNEVWSPRYVEIRNSIIDGSKYGGKFNVISAGGTGRVNIYNTIFYSHTFRQSIHGAVNAYNCTFIGPGSIGTVYSSKFYNCLFVGLNKTDNLFYGSPLYGYGMHNGPRELYNCTFANFYRATQATTHNANIRNSIFYNVDKAHDSGLRKADGSGNIHWNPDGSNQSINYSVNSYDNRTNVEPLFVDTALVYTWNKEDNRTHSATPGYPHHYVEWESYGDWRLVSGSPGIDEADELVYGNTTFTANQNGTDTPYDRAFNLYYTVTDDLNDIYRPQGIGYDIGAFEWYDGQPEEPEASTATDILTFLISGQTGTSTINATNHTVAVTMPSGTNVTSLSATGSVSTGGTVDPIFNTARNYTTPQTFTVTAADETTTQVWTVTVTVASAPPTSGPGLRQGRQLNLGRAIKFGTKYLIINP